MRTVDVDQVALREKLLEAADLPGRAAGLPTVVGAVRDELKETSFQSQHFMNTLLQLVRRFASPLRPLELLHHPLGVRAIEPRVWGHIQVATV